jgi:hypothetical protein
MDAEELRRWMDRGCGAAAEGYGKNPDEFWPQPERWGQGMGTTWAIAAVAAAATDRGPALGWPERELELGVRSGKHWHVNARRHVVDRLWKESAPAGKRRWTPQETLVDITVHDWAAPQPLQIAAESEMCADWDVGDSIDGGDDYSWDFYKLLLVQAPLKLFFARVGPRRAAAAGSGRERRDALVRSLVSVYDSYPRLSRNVELAAVVLAAEGEEPDWRDARYVVFREGGGHETGKLWPE